VFVTAAATMALDPLYTLVARGDPLIHARKLILTRPRKPLSRDDRAFVDRFNDELQSLGDTIAVLPRLLLTWNVGWVFLAFLVLFAVALVVERDRRLLALAIWVVTVWGFMAVVGLGSLPSGRWILNITNIRYWYPLVPPLVIGALGGGFLLVRRVAPARQAAVASIVVTFALALVALVPGVAEYRSCAAKDVWASSPRERWYELRRWLAGSEAQRYDVIRADPQTTRLAPLFMRTTFGDRVWHGRVWPFWLPKEGPLQSPERTNVLVLIHKDRFRAAPVLEELRADRSPVFVSSDGMMVLLARGLTVNDGGIEPWWYVPDDLAKRRSARGCGVNPYTPALP
jgi:hypothetical protein